MSQSSNEARIILALQALQNNPSLKLDQLQKPTKLAIVLSAIERRANNHDEILSQNLTDYLIWKNG
jgi:hypothetical protein